MAFLGVHGDARVVAHMLMGAGGDVEQGGLAAVGVSHQRHADVMVPLFGHVGQGPVQPLLLLQVAGEGLQVLVAHQGLPRLLFRHHVDQARLLPPEGYFVADNLVFDGVPERGVEDDPHFLSVDEPHLYQAFTEAAMSVHTHDDRFLTGSKI